MPDLGTMIYHSPSGVPYKFTTYAWGTNFEAIAVVYVVTRRTQKQDGRWSHSVIYVGETADLSERFDDHHKAACIAQYYPNCICIQRESSQRARLLKEADLVARYKPPCNAAMQRLG